MQLPSRPSRSFSRPVTRRLGLDDGGPASGWSIVEGSDRHDTAAERVAVLAPTEQILMLAVDLPLPSRRQRQEAVPFAVEDLIADPLD
ncbi:MAG: hypothetical protein EOP67_69320, partial [Sphingomonas sp.]